MTSYTITRLGQQGDGIADGPVYAPMSLPGEVVTGQLDGQRLADVKIEKPSSDRVAPPCRHYRSCGGCQLQHASDAFVATWKTDTVRQALAAHDIAVDVSLIETSPPRTRRRATFSARRTKKGALAGFHARASDVIIEVPDCQLLHPDLLGARNVVEELAKIGTSRKAELDVAICVSEGGLDVSVTGGKDLDGPLRQALAATANQFDLARLAWNGEGVVTRRSPAHTFGNATVAPPPGAFLQATPQGQAALTTEVTRILSGAKHVADLFAGCGTFALPLAQNAQVHAVEGDSDMTAALDAGWRGAQGLKAVSVEARDLFRRPLTGGELSGFDGVCIDPPRAGARAQIDALCQTPVPVIAYVSCNATSFARDAAALVQAGYAPGQVKVVDQFRWSTHIELVADFTMTS